MREFNGLLVASLLPLLFFAIDGSARAEQTAGLAADEFAAQQHRAECNRREDSMMRFYPSSDQFVPRIAQGRRYWWNLRALEACNDFDFRRSVEMRCNWVNEVYYRGNLFRAVGLNPGTSFLGACDTTRILYGGSSLVVGQDNNAVTFVDPGPQAAFQGYYTPTEGHAGHQPHSVGRGGRPGIESRGERELEEFFHRLRHQSRVRGR